MKKISRVEVSNTVGQIILKMNKSLKELNKTSLKSGIYYVKIYLQDGKTMTRKIIKK
ncbi:T9SS type A sorting domain-containing protein [Empedobacter brevis]|uniref:T9SS type A sorting domain-containing protein n=1 Tax=Empedobacter brevis TaxID=247 RepID=UPI0039AEE481